MSKGLSTYTLQQLESKALTFLRESKCCKNMPLSDKKELARMKATAASRSVESLVASGLPDFIAWPRAINEEILEMKNRDCFCSDEIEEMSRR